ncbi:N-formylglutamate amidohydrolase [Kovacikia minuta CCNUW1]|uniref:N-formylglutamate amidohydrolase n=1 Tax=Kovacikia minuta TaxID=2931930 RepID=UPI001CCC1CE7|nr:N-formylglutamate amidohydrolase [Kovacikia minuta]UBF26978.1 N-formylglutamate amidohydrolase [Kovacikia minuta CCNUW1]
MDLFNLHLPKGGAIPIVANLPHSGMFVPDVISKQLTQEHLQSLPNTDWYLDQMYHFLPDLGITVLQATHSRYVVDLNRQLQDPVFGSFWTSVIPAATAMGNPIYTTVPNAEQIQERIRDFYLPYHAKLSQILQEKVATFGKVYLLDLHSFGGLITDDICLGNRNGQTCSELLISSAERQFLHRGYQVVRNKVFTGGYITGHYGQLSNVEALQIEVRYHVYLDENELERSQPPNWQVPKFEIVKRKFAEVFAALAQEIAMHGES